MMTFENSKIKSKFIVSLNMLTNQNFLYEINRK